MSVTEVQPKLTTIKGGRRVTLLDYTALFEPTGKPLLWLSYNPADPVLRWHILDANRDHELYCRAATLDHAIAFIRAAERKGDATVDEASIEFHRMLRTTLNPPDDFSRAVLADVIPIRRDVA